MSVNWDTSSLDKIEADFKKNLQKAALFVKGKIKEKINRSQNYVRTKGPGGVYYHGQDPSLPGEPPKRVTGQLVRSIATQQAPDGMNWLVGTNLAYGLYLEFGTSKMAARPWLRSTLEENKEAILNIISGQTT